MNRAASRAVHSILARRVRLRPVRQAPWAWIAPLLFVACGGSPESPGLPTELTATPELSLVWSDEFNGARGAPVDSAKWASQVGGTGWGQGLLDYKTNCTDPSAPNFTTENAQMDGQGNLVIRAQREGVPYDTCWYGECEITSALLITAATFQRQYGRFEVRMETPPGAGLWASFWLYGAHENGLWGEIDVAEVIGPYPDTVFQAAHGPGALADDISRHREVPDGSVAGEFHVYAVDWLPGELRYYIDGRLATTITPLSWPRGAPWPFDSHPFYLVLDLSVGSAQSWPGAPDERTPFPAELIIDYVRVYEIE
jgi:beta-glucanase (GH16 family)